MFNIIVALIVLLALIVVDKKINFTDKKKLKITYGLINTYVFALIITGFVLAGLGYKEVLMVAEKAYYIGMIIFALGLLVLEFTRGRDIKTLWPIIIVALVYGILVRLAKTRLIFGPIVLSLFLTKFLVSLFYPNIKTNFILAYKRHLDEGYAGLRFKDRYNDLFYRGDFFHNDLVNRVFSFFSAGYKLKVMRKRLIYGSENVDDQYNLMTVIEHYEREEEGVIVFNRIERSINNRYEESDVFKLDEITEITNGDYFKTYLATKLITYPKVDFQYKTYIIDLSIIKGNENFSLFDVNKRDILDVKISKDYRVTMENLRDDDRVEKYLHNLVKKDVIYTSIVDFLNKGDQEVYEFNRTKNFKLAYDEGIKCFKVYSGDFGLLGMLKTEDTSEIVNINMPLKDNIVFEEYDLDKEVQEYSIYMEEDMVDSPYNMEVEFYIQVDMKQDRQEEKPRKDPRPNFNLIGRIKLDLSI